MKSKLYSQKKRNVEGLKSCVIIMIILLVITVAVSTMSSYVGQRSIDPSKFDANIDIRKEFSVPYYSCPVEIDISIRGGGNATFYLVKGKDLSNNPLEDEENAKYVANNTVAIETNSRNFHLERDLDPGEYTLYVLHLQEKKNNEQPIMVGIGVDEDQTGAIAYTSYSKVQYNKLNIFVLKPVLPFVYIIFIICEILLIIWFFSFIVRRRLVKEEAEPQPVPNKVRIEKVPKRDATSAWNATLRGEATVEPKQSRSSRPPPKDSTKKKKGLGKDIAKNSRKKIPKKKKGRRKKGSKTALEEAKEGRRKKGSKRPREGAKEGRRKKGSKTTREGAKEGRRKKGSKRGREEKKAGKPKKGTKGRKETKDGPEKQNKQMSSMLDELKDMVPTTDSAEVPAYIPGSRAGPEKGIKKPSTQDEQSKDNNVSQKDKLEDIFARILKEKSEEIPAGSEKQAKMDTLNERMNTLLGQIIEK